MECLSPLWGLESSFGGRQLVMIDVATDSHAEGTCQRLEDAFDFVVLVGAFGLDVEVHPCGIAQALEEVQEHLCGHFAYALAMEFGIPHQPGAAAKVECHGAEAVVHGQTVAIALDAPLVAKGLEDAFAKSQRRVFYGVVLVDMQVSLRSNGEIHHSVSAYLLEHVVEESQACGDVALASSIDVEKYVDVGLFRCAVHLSRTFSRKQQFGYSFPIHPFLPKDKRLAANVFGELAVGIAVANYIAVGDVVFIGLEIFAQHACSRLAVGVVVFGEMAVDFDVVERDAFAFEGLQDEVVDGPEGIFGERRCAQSVLVADHHKAEVKVLAYEGKIAEDAFHKAQFLERINLLVGRFVDKGAVAVDE